jgi:Carboxypeptidase regulatory-like domain/TonB-dependent Receptor Plug Domain
MVKGFTRVLLCLSVALFVLLIGAGPLWAQAQTATISGTATDASGAAMVGAKIQATNTETNASQSTVSDAQGRYTLSDLPVGTYNVQASQSGFQTVVHTGVTLSVGGAVVVNFSMPVGEVKETVSVESQVSRVETTTSEVSTLVSPKQMRELPLNGRNFEQLLALAPGVSTIAPADNAVTGRLYGMMNNYSIAGSRPTGQMFLLDGTDIRDFWEHATGSGYAGTSLGVEAIGQFQVLTSDYTAQYGGNGAVMNAVSRSGTNDVHGGAYEFIRNSRLDALDAPDKIAGLTTPPPFRRNQFGVAIGGPIKKNKLFFFGNYEGLREGLETTTPISVPEPYVTAGMLPCYNPLNGTVLNNNASCPGAPPTPGANQAWAAPGTAANPIEPVNGANAQEEAISSLYSLCRGCSQIQSTLPILVGGASNGSVTFAPGADLGGYLALKSAPNLITNEDYTLGRVDYTIGPSDNTFARYVLDDARVADNPRDPFGIFPEVDFTRNQFLTITENHIFSPTTINSIRFGFVRTNENSRVPGTLTSAQISAASTFSTSVGGPAFTTDPLAFQATSPGELLREDGSNGAFASIGPVGPDPNRPDELIQNKFSGGDDLTLNRGGHSLKIGGVITRIQTQNLQTAYSNGGFFLSYASGFFGESAAQLYLQGFPFLAFGVPAGLNNATRYFREIAIAPYIQDDWKVTPRLTLNLGFRVDYNTNPVGWSYGNLPLSTLVGSYLPPVGPVILPPSPNTPANYAPFSAVKHVFANNPNAEDFEPRFGFAYSPFKDNKTAFRGGIGVFYDPTAARLWESNFINTAPSGSNFLIFPGFPNPYVGGFGISAAPGEFAGVTYQLSGNSAITSGSPYEIQYSFSVQRQLTPATILSIAYVGSVSRHLWTQGDINPPQCVTFPNCTALPQVPTARPSASSATYTFVPGSANGCSDPAQNDATAGVGLGKGCYGSGVQFPCLQPGAIPGTTVPGPPCSSQGPRINATFGSVIQAYNNGASGYNSLQVSLNHQFASNFTAQVNYTWSRCIDNGSFASSLEEFAQLQTDRYNTRYDYANCTFDLRHNFIANALYTLPFKGNRLVEGWRFSTILGIHTGLPLNVYNSGINFADPADLGTQWGSRANYSYAPGCHPNHIINKAVGVGTIQWFDPSCYEAQAPGFLGNVQRDSLPGPGTISADFSITKETKLTERLNMEFRAEVFNFINHFNIGGANAGILGEINAPNSGITQLSQNPVVTPRQIQFAVKFDF